ncbi:MAG: hypothetical protein M3145_10050, partial [Pseudomonadota bacterium]|nr:hypothetical protein [Pseudomonadota bacterium]
IFFDRPGLGAPCFHIRGLDHGCPDSEGGELVDTAAAFQHALEDARDLVGPCVWDIKEPAQWWIEIVDEIGEPLFMVRLSEVATTEAASADHPR